MAELKNVIYDIERCICHVPDACRDCSHYPDKNGGPIGCMEDLLSEALELLKEQVKTEVVFKEYDGILESECGNCGQHLDKAYSNCPKCNKALDWNKNQN